MDATPDEGMGGCGSGGEGQDGHWVVEEQLHHPDIVEDSYEYEEFASDNPYIYKQEEVEVCEEGETTALDLRVMRQSGECLKLPKFNSIFNKCKGEVGIYRVMDHIYHNAILNDGLQQKMTFNDPHFYNKSEFFMYDNNSVENSVTATDYSTGEGSGGHDYKCEKVFWDCSTNTEPTIMVDKATQTEYKEDEKSIQTDPYPGLAGLLTFPKGTVKKYFCSLCKRLYSAKSSYERHLRSHRSIVDAKSLTYVRLTTEAKLQVYKQREVTRHRPLIIQMPQPSNLQHQCAACKRVFRSTLERDRHHCIPELPMTKCPQCPIMFYTSGGLEDHIELAHNKMSSPDSSYYCVFCGESFDTGYSFHLHLDHHLSP